MFGTFEGSFLNLKIAILGGNGAFEAPTGRPGHRKCLKWPRLCPPWPGAPGRRAHPGISQNWFLCPGGASPLSASFQRISQLAAGSASPFLFKPQQIWVSRDPWVSDRAYNFIFGDSIPTHGPLGSLEESEVTAWSHRKCTRKCLVLVSV